MKGSWSLKAVLPTIAADLSYAELDDVQHGGMVQVAFMEIVNPETAPERLIRSLENYCRQDTLALVRLAHFLTSGKA